VVIQTKLGNDAVSPPLFSSFCNFSCGCVSWSLFH